MKKIFLFLPVLLFIISCSDDEPICNNSDCIIEITCPREAYIPVEDSISSSWGTQYNNVDGTQQAFSTNPNNSNELVYINTKIVDFLATYQLFIYNKGTKQKQLIYESPGLYGLNAPLWSRDNWIYFNSNSHIFKIKSDGSDLTQVTFGSYINRLRAITLDGEELIYYDDSSFSLVKIDLETNENKVFPINTEAAFDVTISPDNNQMIFLQGKATGGSDIIKYNFTTEEKEIIFEINDASKFGVCWSKDGEYIYWSDISGLYRLNVSNNYAEKITKHFGSGLRYEYPHFDNNGTLYLRKETAWKSGGNEISLKGEIIEYDLNTCTEIDIFE